MEIKFDRFTLDNGLKVIVHQDRSTPMVAVNVLYNVGARDEDPEHTGFAHLFEHLMFGGSVNIPSYDEPLQRAGGENNAYTTNDITNYYIQLPKENMETAFWLESDRMLSLAFSPRSLEVQRKVVCEEFKEHYLNMPYGDAWKYLRELAYKVHPYQWMTIGKNLEQIEQATLDEVKAFFKKHYCPANAILCVAGNVTTGEIKTLSEKYFGPVPSGEVYVRHLSQEPQQTERRFKEIRAKVPLDAIYKAWHIADRLSPGYYYADIITEILGNGNASRLFQKLVKEKQLFSQISCYHTGSLDPGLLVITGKLVKGVTLEEADAAIEAEVDDLMQNAFSDTELEKAKNKIESAITFEDMSLLARANNLAFYQILGDAGMMNTEMDKYLSAGAAAIQAYVREIFRKENSNTLFYRAEA
ncbi:MAG TPA: pitrilysin family protein [Edaphocola sp.]|nr:pitrilysin family protein [Edaphocola sp.]